MRPDTTLHYRLAKKADSDMIYLIAKTDEGDTVAVVAFDNIQDVADLAAVLVSEANDPLLFSAWDISLHDLD